MTNPGDDYTRTCALEDAAADIAESGDTQDDSEQMEMAKWWEEEQL